MKHLTALTLSALSFLILFTAAIAAPDSHAILPVPNSDSFEYLWVSPTQILTFTHTYRPSGHLVDNDLVQITMVDVNTRKRTPLPQLSRLMTETHGSIWLSDRGDAAVSPDGKKLLWAGFTQNPKFHFQPGKPMSIGEEMYPASFSACMANLDGTVYLKYGIGAVMGVDALGPHLISWCADSHHWNEYMNCQVPLGKQPYPIDRTHAADRGITMAFARSADIHSDFGIATAVNIKLGLPGSDLIFPAGGEELLIGDESELTYLYSFPLSNAAATPKLRELKAPPSSKTWIGDFAFSHSGDHIIWATAKEGKVSIEVWEEKLLGKEDRDFTKPTHVATISGKDDILANMQCSPDGHLLAYTFDKKLWILSLPGGFVSLPLAKQPTIKQEATATSFR